VQDLSMVHVTSGRFSTSIGDDVTVGHRAILHGCTVGNRVLVGMGTILLDGVVVEDDTIIGAGSLVSPGTRVTGGMLWLGSPARAVRPLREAELASLIPSAAHYCVLAQRHAAARSTDVP
jgi:carbonic anhydrase/acetyltransferase-like protein (isoleucine patch superfamily)